VGRVEDGAGGTSVEQELDSDARARFEAKTYARVGKDLSGDVGAVVKGSTSDGNYGAVGEDDGFFGMGKKCDTTQVMEAGFGEDVVLLAW
jgi:hypothetical protein